MDFCKFILQISNDFFVIIATAAGKDSVHAASGGRRFSRIDASSASNSSIG